MWFLILEIFFLLLLAAAFGAWLGYWWSNRHREDVTHTYESDLDGTRSGRPPAISKTDLDAGFSTLSSKFSDIPKVDLSPLEERMASLEAQLKTPDSDVPLLATRLTEVERTLGNVLSSTNALTNTDIAPLERQLDALADLMGEQSGPDLTEIQSRLSGIEDALNALPTTEAPDIDLGPIHSGLTRLEMSMANLDIPTTDLTGIETRLDTAQEKILQEQAEEMASVKTRIASVSTLLGSLRMPDMTPFDQRLDDIETRIAHISLPEPDLRPIDEGLNIIHGRLSGLESQIGDATQRLPDPALLQQRIDQMQSELLRLERMEATLGALRMDLDMQKKQPGFEAVEQRLAMLQSDVSNQPTPDLTPVLHSVQAMERRMDLGAMEHRLTSIEYGLAALHHMLRTRPANGPLEPDMRPAEPRPAAPSSYAPRPAPPPPGFAPPPQYDRWPEPEPVPYAFDSYGSLEPHPYEPAREPRNYREPAPASALAPREDTISDARRPGDEANLLTRPAFGAPDQLEDISGVGPMLHGLLTEIGVYYFWQVAEWGPREIMWVDNMLDGFNGRIERDDWVGQARILAAKPETANRP